MNVVVAFDSEGSVVKGTGGKREWWKSKTHRHTHTEMKKKKEVVVVERQKKKKQQVIL